MGRTLKSVLLDLDKLSPFDEAGLGLTVGLLIEPSKDVTVKNIILANKLNEHVMQEAMDKQTNMVISYRSPIGVPQKRTMKGDVKDRIVACCFAKSIAVTVPYKSWWHEIPGGINDWLASAIPSSDAQPIRPYSFSRVGGVVGAGRIITTNLSLHDALDKICKLVGSNVNICYGLGHNLETRVRKIAISAGPDKSLLRGQTADLFVTGRMSRDDLVEAIKRQTSVVCWIHKDIGISFLNELKVKLDSVFMGECQIVISDFDANTNTDRSEYGAEE